MGLICKKPGQTFRETAPSTSLSKKKKGGTFAFQADRAQCCSSGSASSKLAGPPKNDPDPQPMAV